MIYLNSQNQNLFETTQSALLSLNWENPEVYKDWLAQTHFFVNHSTRIIASAAVNFPLEKNNLHLRFLQHAGEEKNHEIILLSDLKALEDDISNHTPLPVTEAFYQTQYYWIHQINPISVYGYFILLETLAVECGPQILRKLRNHYPEKACKFLKVHAEEDVDHMQSHNQLLEQLSPQDRELIQKNFFVSNGLYFEILKNLELLSLRAA